MPVIKDPEDTKTGYLQLNEGDTRYQFFLCIPIHAHDEN